MTRNEGKPFTKSAYIKMMTLDVSIRPGLQSQDEAFGLQVQRSKVKKRPRVSLLGTPLVCH